MYFPFFLPSSRAPVVSFRQSVSEPRQRRLEERILIE